MQAYNSAEAGPQPFDGGSLPIAPLQNLNSRIDSGSGRELSFALGACEELTLTVQRISATLIPYARNESSSSADRKIIAEPYVPTNSPHIILFFSAKPSPKAKPSTWKPVVNEPFELAPEIVFYIALERSMPSSQTSTVDPSLYLPEFINLNTHCQLWQDSA